jgi:hypothetical protein
MLRVSFVRSEYSSGWYGCIMARLRETVLLEHHGVEVIAVLCNINRGQ